MVLHEEEGVMVNIPRLIAQYESWQAQVRGLGRFYDQPDEAWGSCETDKEVE